MTVIAPEVDPGAPPPSPAAGPPAALAAGQVRRGRARAFAVARLVGAGIMPSTCFIVGRHSFGLAGAVTLSVLWGVGYQLVSHHLGRRWSVLVTMNLSELLVRATVSLWLGSTTAFFVLPSVMTAVFGAVYIVSCLVGRPLLSLIAAEVLPGYVVDSWVTRRTQALRWASIAYGTEQMVVAGLSILLALSLDPSTYAAVHPPMSWATLAAGGLLYWLWCRYRLPERRLTTS